MKQPRLLHNIAALGSLQIANYFLVFVTLPFVTRALGVETWGKVAFAQLMLNYCMWVTNWGFFLSATRKVAANRNDSVVLSEIFMATWIGQWILAALVIVTLIGLFTFAPFFSADRDLYIYGIGLIIGNVLFPGWFLNGLERMKEVAIMQIIAKVPTIPLIVFLINDTKDAPLYIGINAANGLLAGILILGWMRMKLPMRWTFPHWKSVFAELMDGATLFASTAWSSLYTTLTPTILGVLAGPVALGTFNLADRARAAAQAILTPVTSALFPRMSRLFVDDPAEAAKMLWRAGAVIISISASASIALWFFADPIVLILGGTEFKHASEVLRWLAPLPLAGGLSAFLGMQIMLPARKTRPYFLIIAAAGCLNLLAIAPLIHWKGVDGAAMSILLTECFAALAMLAYVSRNRFFLKGVPSLQGKPI